MFENVGQKIKTISIVLMVLGCLGALYFGVTIFDALKSAFGLVIILAGCLGSWISACLLYGFGELVDCAQKNSDRIWDLRSNVDLIHASLKKHVASTKEKLATIEYKLATIEKRLDEQPTKTEE